MDSFLPIVCFLNSVFSWKGLKDIRNIPFLIPRSSYSTILKID